MTRVESKNDSHEMTANAEHLADRSYVVALGALFFLSGALALLYEIVWLRRLHLTVGVSIFAIGAVVSAFMLGLSFGSRWASRSGMLRDSPLKTYAWLEIGVALYALAFPLVIEQIEALYPVLYRLLAVRHLALTASRFCLAFIVLLPPTFLMGASLPAIAQAAFAPAGRLAHRVAWLYALNAVGGAAGTLAAGFVMIERLGVIASLHVGVWGSFLVAAGAYALARHPAYRERLEAQKAALSARKQKRRQSTRDRPRQRLVALATAAAFTAGLVSLAAEIVWTRALVFFIHNSTYAFSAILAVYLLGVAAGASGVSRFVRGSANALRVLAAVTAAASLSLLVAIAVYRHLPEIAPLLAGKHRLDPVLSGGSEAAVLVWSWSAALLMIFGQVAATLFLPALLLGAVFPLTIKIVESPGGGAAAVVGRLYAINAFGSVAGIMLGTFLLVAFYGTRGALLLLAWLPAPIVLWALWTGTTANRARTAFASLFMAALAIGGLAAAPRGFYRDLFQRRFGRVVWFSEGISETVAVCDHPDGSRWIQFSDGRGASGTRSFQGGWLYAHLPLLLHPAPESAAVVCFGTGNTLGAASLHRLKSLDGIELSPEVVKAAHLFARTNHDVANNKNVRLIIEDGRNYLLATDKRYDVITEEPPLVHTAGVVHLYSKDFYELCSRRLTENGILAVWLATWELETQELQMLVRAFVDVFPYASVWDCAHPYEWLLIGSKRPPAIDLGALSSRMAEPAIAADLARIEAEHGGIRTPADLLSLHLRGRAALIDFAGAVSPVTDDKTVVDFTTPRHARANFGLGEWVTGGLTALGIGRHGLSSELRLREFDGIYAFRESAQPLVSNHGVHDPERFSEELRARARRREMRAARLTLHTLKLVASDLRALGRKDAALATLQRGRDLVPDEASGPIHVMRAQLLHELGRFQEAREARSEASRVEATLDRRRLHEEDR
ncbi:MAG: fused MFS/spermidine synthase [Vicinamibacteria bacterium]|nr:fused MFS/spermidine synthase [Vicinamibacteria bacterium]